MSRGNVGAIGFGLAAVLFVVAAVLPATRGGPLNVTFLALAMVFLVLAIAANRKARQPPGS